MESISLSLNLNLNGLVTSLPPQQCDRNATEWLKPGSKKSIQLLPRLLGGLCWDPWASREESEQPQGRHAGKKLRPHRRFTSRCSWSAAPAPGLAGRFRQHGAERSHPPGPSWIHARVYIYDHRMTLTAESTSMVKELFLAVNFLSVYCYTAVVTGTLTSHMETVSLWNLWVTFHTFPLPPSPLPTEAQTSKSKMSSECGPRLNY